jgi:hypothetical protein
MPAPVGNKQGLSSNPDNINRKGIKGPRGRRSELRKLLKKLSQLEDASLENIEKSIKGEDVPKDQLSSSKWVIERIVSTTTAAVGEEQRKNAIKKSLEENSEDTPEEDNSTPEVPVRRFSLTMLHGNKED